MAVHTLSRWADRLLKGPITIECPGMEVLGRDHEPPVFTGPGHIEIGADTRMHFVMHGTPRDGADAFRTIVNAQRNPYSTLDQFRINAVAYDGTEWVGGWTSLRFGEEARGVWRLFGHISGLHTDTSGFGVSDKSGVELVYDQRLRLPIPMNMATTVQRNGKEVLYSRRSGSKTIRVLDSEIEFFCSVEGDQVWAVADTSPSFPHPYLENWLSEPLNLLLSHIVSPRLTARNFGDGRAYISLRPASWRPARTIASSILREDPLGAGERFWQLYGDILSMVATARDASGNRHFEAHQLTRYYWEIIQAVNGSNWVLCLTLASAVEGVVKMMFSAAERKSDWDESEVEGLRGHVKNWKGNENLRGAALNYLNGFKTKGIAKTLEPLVNAGIVSKEQVGAWIRLRNSSMHGEMVVPWSDQEQDVQIENLLELFHRISEEYVRRQPKV